MDISDYTDKPKTCPISEMMMVFSGANDDDNNVIFAGGEEYVIDGAEYILTKDAVEIARFEARNSRKEGDELKTAIDEFLNAQYGAILGLDFIGAYSVLFPQVLVNHDIIGEQLNAIFSAISVQFDKSTCDNCTIPEFICIKDAHYVVSRRPDILKYQIECIAEFARDFRINNHTVITAISPNIDIPEFPSGVFPKSAETIAEVKDIYLQKKQLIDYMIAVESAHKLAIVYFEEVIKCIK
jgi:hypothetical protein